ncbi:MAG: hypothetical protein ACOC6E_01090 [Thermodesulfobacteriota bacterium]
MAAGHSIYTPYSIFSFTGLSISAMQGTMIGYGGDKRCG